MSIINKYLNLNSNELILRKLEVDDKLYSSLINYDICFKNYLNNPESLNDYIQKQMKTYIDKNYSLINVIDADINYYIEQINLFANKKLKNIVREINIEHIVSLCDYFKNTKCDMSLENNYIYWSNKYYEMLYENIICGKYKIFSQNEKKSIGDLLKDEWNKINFSNIIDFSNTLSKIKFMKQNVDEYINIIVNKFDEPENISKLIEYINKKLQIEQKSHSKSNTQLNKSVNDDMDMDMDMDDEQYNLVTESIENKSKYNFRFIIENLKSNGYLLFEELNNIIKNKYKKVQPIQTIKTDKRIINYCMYIISQKDSSLTNRKVNEILIKMKNYLEDIEESYYNNLSYRKITVKQESEKYKSVDLSQYNRENATFTIFKYYNSTQTDMRDTKNLCLNSQIEPYFDIYKSYYTARYPDREIEFDPIQSTMIVKMVFISKVYYIHLSLIQYIVLDKLFNAKDGLGIKDISIQTNIPIKNLQETINSLLHIKLIKRFANATSVQDMKLFINHQFVHENNKISISSLIATKNNSSSENNEKKEFLHNRNTIILSNIYDYAKKNKIFTIDKIYNDLSKNKIPFEIELEQIMEGIKNMLEKEDIVESIQNQIKVYKYSE